MLVVGMIMDGIRLLFVFKGYYSRSSGNVKFAFNSGTYCFCTRNVLPYDEVYTFHS